MQLDALNKNTKWYDATQLELQVMTDYKVFKDNGYDIPQGYKGITVNIILMSSMMAGIKLD